MDTFVYIWILEYLDFCCCCGCWDCSLVNDSSRLDYWTFGAPVNKHHHILKNTCGLSHPFFWGGGGGGGVVCQNDKPWFSTKLRKQLHKAKEDAYRSGDKALYKQSKYTLNRENRVAKKNYSGKVKKLLSSNDLASVWKGLKAIISYKTPSPSTEANQQLAEDLNKFYCQFEKHLWNRYSPSSEWDGF